MPEIEIFSVPGSSKMSLLHSFTKTNRYCRARSVNSETYVFFWIVLTHLKGAGLYGVRRIQFFSAQAPISPRSTGSPGAVLRPGARQYVNHIAKMYSSRVSRG